MGRSEIAICSCDMWEMNSGYPGAPISGMSRPATSTSGVTRLEPSHRADQHEHQAARDDVPGDAGYGRDQLSDKLAGGVVAVKKPRDISRDVVVSVAIGAVGEQSHGKNSPQSADAMNADRADRIVDAVPFSTERSTRRAVRRRCR